MSRKRGDIGEDIACTILISKGFIILTRNFYTRYGEIDIIAQRGLYTHFIEVKTTYGSHNPTENFSHRKLKRFVRAVKIYCYLHKISDELLEIDLALVDMHKRIFRFVRNANLYFH